jgi:type VI secretion system secreted protein Hcp
MANAIYLKIDGAPGLSKNKGHEGEIELESYSFGASQQSTMGHGGGGGSGKVQFDQFTFHAKVGKESPEVWFALCQGKHIPKIVLTSEKAGGAGGPVKHVVIELKDCMFTHYSMSDSLGATDPQGGYSLDFAEAKFDYQPQNKEGGKDGAVVTHSWNSSENKGS